MRLVYKYPLAADPGNIQTIKLTGPTATAMSVGVQGKQIVVWAVETVYPPADKAPSGYLNLMLTWTGDPPPVDSRFIGTVTTPDGLVWHLWQV